MNPKTYSIESIGIALAAYKPEPSFFKAQLQSIQDQTFRLWKCFITCDSSLPEIFASGDYASFVADSRFIWSENPVRLGHKKNFEYAMSLAANACDAVAPSDQDDIWYAEKLETCRTNLERAGPGAVVHSDMHVLQGATRLSETAWTIEKRGIGNCRPCDLIVRNVVAGCGMLIDSELVRAFPEIPEGAEYHDHWYALVAATHGGVYPIHDPLYEYRQHGSNTVGVTPFPGTFAGAMDIPPAALVQKLIRTHLRSEKLARSARAANLRLGRFTHMTALGRWDLGLGYALLALRAFSSGDRALARACIARTFGKLLSTFSLIKSEAL